MPEGPVVVGVFHRSSYHKDEDCIKASDRLEAYLEGKAKEGEKKRLFLELNTAVLGQLKRYVTGTRHEESGLFRHIGKFCVYRPNPFETAVAVALKHGWEIVPLEKQGYGSVFTRFQQAMPEYRAYTNMNLREAAWAAKASRERAKHGDFFVMDPSHASAFSEEAGKLGVKISHIEFASVPEKAGLQRLSESEVKALREIRLAQRRRRKPKAFNPPTKEELERRPKRPL